MSAQWANVNKPPELIQAPVLANRTKVSVMLSSYSFRYLQSLHTAERAALQCLWGRLVSSRTAHRTSESLQEEGVYRLLLYTSYVLQAGLLGKTKKLTMAARLAAGLAAS